MAKRYSRQEFLDRLWSEIKRGKQLAMAAAGNGLAAKFIERSGVDILGVYNTGYFRMQGYGSLAGMLPMFDANQLVSIQHEKKSLRRLKKCRWWPASMELMFCGIWRSFWRTAAGLALRACTFSDGRLLDGEFRKTPEETGLGYQKEIDMLNSARELDMLTVGYAFNEVDKERLMRGAAPDIYIFHAGITSGGSTGYGSGRSLEDMAAHPQALGAVAKAIKPDVILLAHGASLTDPHDAQYLLEN